MSDLPRIIENAPGPRVRERTPLQKGVISAYLATFLIVVSAWVFPDQIAPDKWQLTRFTWPVMATMGWVQCWTLFCPTPRDINVHANALIQFKDGSTKIYEFPRTQKMDLFTKFQREKTRKLFVDNMCWPSTSMPLLPSISRFIAKANDDKTNPPDTITLMVNNHLTPPPDPAKWVFRDELPEHTYKSLLFTYKVQASDLKRD